MYQQLTVKEGRCRCCNDPCPTVCLAASLELCLCFCSARTEWLAIIHFVGNLVVTGAPGQGKKRSLLSIFGGLKLRKGPAVGTGPAKDSPAQADKADAKTAKATDSATNPEEVAVTLGTTQDASKLGMKVVPGEQASSSSSSSSADSQAEPLYNNNGKGASQTPSEDSFPDAVKSVTAANDTSSGQVRSTNSFPWHHWHKGQSTSD